MNRERLETATGLHLGLLCSSEVPDAVARDFEHAVAADGLDLLIERREGRQIYAGLEWLMPTAVIAYVAKSYFDGFLKEMGKEHYLATKAALKQIADRLSNVRVTRLGTPGKTSNTEAYSSVFSICFDREPDGRFKFLIPVSLTPEEFDQAMGALFSFMEDYLAGPSGTPEREALRLRLACARPHGGTVLLAYNLASGVIETVDPLDIPPTAVNKIPACVPTPR